LIDWFCSNLGLPLIEEKSNGELRLNSAARDIAGAGAFPTIAAALGLALGEALEACTLEARLADARRGEPSELTLAEGLRLLIAPADPGHACVVLAPGRAIEDVALQRRALATDRSARVSHELANALGAIAGWARLAKDGAPIEEALDLIEKSADNAWIAARTVLGEVSGQPQQHALQSPTIDLSEFTEEAARLLLPKALKKNVTIRTTVQPGLHVACDRSSAWAIVWNLACNAIEALPAEGSVTLQLTEAGERVQLCVLDDGPGMSAEVRSRIFEPYFTTKRMGTGLGLAMVKQSVIALGGSIDVESEPQRGTRFVVELPTSRAHARRLSKRASGVFVTDPIDARILVIDDDASLREMIGTALQMRGAEVELAASLHEALQLRGPFRLAVVDYLLGEHRGDAALAGLRAANLAHVGLLVTGTDVPRKLVAGGEPQAILRKPFELNDLFEQIAELLKRHPERQSRVG
jgi:signal transduction histidine kinase